MEDFIDTLVMYLNRRHDLIKIKTNLRNIIIKKKISRMNEIIKN